MFMTKLAKVPRSEILNLLPQIRVVKAFKDSVKKVSKGKEETEDENEFACFITKKEEKSEEDKGSEDSDSGRNRHDSDEQTECESLFPKKKEEDKGKGKRHASTQMSPHHEPKMRNAYDMSFGARRSRR